MQDILWPVRGALLFLRHPSWWIRPLASMLLSLCAFIGLGIGTAWWLWPGEADAGWLYWWWSLFAIGMGCVVVVVMWVVMLPMIMSFLLEDLARQVLRYTKQHGTHLPHLGRAEQLSTIVTGIDKIQHQELPMVPGLLATLKVLGGTLIPRMGWIGASFVSGLIVPPTGVVVSALGMGHIACIDACDIAMSLHGFDGQRRLSALRAHRVEIRQAALAAGLLNLGLAVTVIGWVIWLPGVIVGAVLRTQSWDEIALPLTPTAPTVPSPTAQPSNQ
jgi:hypothetical protein